MNTVLTISLSVLLTSLAHADFNSDVPGKSVRCTAYNTIVVINKARTEITVIDAMDAAHPEKYAVTARDSDGDTFVSYEAKNQEVTLDFDDQGDVLVYPDVDPISLKCN